MAKNMTISVPNDLHEAIKNTKGGVKPSAICQEALWKAAKIAQAIENEDVSALNEKFEQERKKLFQKYYDEGLEDGRKDAFSFDYSRAKSFFEFIKKWGADDSGTFEYNASRASRDKYDSFTVGDLPHSIDCDMDDDWVQLQAADMYYDGWVDGARLVLNKALYGKDQAL